MSQLGTSVPGEEIPSKFVGFSTKALQTADCQWGLGQFLRYEGVHDAKHEADHANHGSSYFHQFEGFHIFLNDGHSACHTDDMAKLATSAHTELAESLKTSLEPY